MLSKFTLIIILVFLFFIVSSLTLANLFWEKISGSIFIIYFQGHDLNNSEKILHALQLSHQRLVQEIGAELRDSVSVFVAPSEKIFQQLVGDQIPEWSEGIAVPGNNVIILKSASWMPPEVDNIAIAVHELTHIMIYHALRGCAIPRWLNEGLAIHYSGEKRYTSGSLISKALMTGSIIPLAEIDEVLKFHTDKAQLAYQESYLAVDYVFQQYGRDAVKTILSKLGDGTDLDVAFLEVLNMESWDFEQEWLAYIKQKYRWHFLIEFDNYLWVLILALFIIGFLIMRRRNKRIIQRWQEEDETKAPW